ncbi:MAG: transglycosylase SLT domain-containing protein [Thermoanaerobaculia bacterium]
MSHRRGSTTLFAVLVAAGPAAADNPRLELVELRLAGRDEEALAFVQHFRQEQPRQAQALGFDYAAGRLAEALGQLDAAEEAYAAALSSPEALVPFARYRLALRQYAIGHPEVAAGLAATALGKRPPRSLAESLTSLLVRSIADGGDCRLLAGLQRDRLPAPLTRSLTLAVARCAGDAGDRDDGLETLLELLAERTNDETALEATRLVSEWTAPEEVSAEAAARVGAALHDHREFTSAIPWLEQAAAESRGGRRAETRYLLARSRFWRGEYREAARQFELAAEAASGPRERARSLYQQGRALELAGLWPAAATVYREIPTADPTSGWAPAALLSALRLDWRAGREEEALDDLEALRANRRWQATVDRAGLFLAASDITRRNAERAPRWLALVVGGEPDVDLQETYWRGRLAELEEQPAAAVERYAQVLRRAAAHPLALSARTRLAQPPLATEAVREGLRLAATSGRRQLFAAWLLLGDGHLGGATARLAVEQDFARDQGVAALAGAQTLPPSRWRLWDAEPTSPEEGLLALGVWDEGASAVAARFPLDDPALALTGIDLLVEGEQHREALRRAEILARRLPGALPVSFYPRSLRERLFPRPWWPLIDRETARQQVPGLLLTAVMREESRFDAAAVSEVGARGLTQFVPDTARRLARRAGLPQPRPEDLHDPETAIRLGAAYLGALLTRFDGQILSTLASYNAGEDQAGLWRSYCFSPDPAEYFTKVGFPETRAYLVKVVESWVRYEELYGQDGAQLRLDR